MRMKFQQKKWQCWILIKMVVRIVLVSIAVVYLLFVIRSQAIPPYKYIFFDILLTLLTHCFEFFFFASFFCFFFFLFFSSQLDIDPSDFEQLESVDVFKIFDDDNSGYIDSSELPAYMIASLEAADGDGLNDNTMLTLDEFRKVYNYWYTTTEHHYNEL